MQLGAGITRKSRRTRTRRTRTRRTRPKLIARPLGYERAQTRNGRIQNQIMATAVLGEGATQPQIRDYAAKLRGNRFNAKTKYRSMRRTKRNESKTQTLIDFDKNLQIAIRIFNNDYLPSAADQETVEQYHYAIQQLNRLNAKVNTIAGKVLNGKMPDSDVIRALHKSLTNIFESVGADISDIENAKSEKRFSVTSLRNALLE